MAALNRTAASLRIVGPNLDPDEITRLLGKTPERAERRGQVIRGKSGHERTARQGRWSVSAEPCSPGDLDAQIAALLAGTTDDLAVWRKVVSAFRADVFCGLFLEESNEGLEVSPATLKLLGDRGLKLDLDIYGGGNQR
jgi:hypothetical protein